MKNFLINYFKEKNIDISLDEDIFENGYIDSIGFFRLLMELEVNFEKEIPLDLFENIKIYSINEIVKLLEV